MLKENYKEILTLLINEELNSGKVFRFTVSTRSMLPLIKPRDRIAVRKYPLETLRCGDIVVFNKNRELCTHRLLFKKTFNSEIKFITKGDNSLIVDEPISGEQLLGKVIGIERGNRFFDLESKFWKSVNGLARTLSCLEWSLFKSLRNLKRRILKI